MYPIERKDLLKPLGQLCKKARQESGYSVKEMSEILGVTKNAVYRFERGHYDTATFFMLYIYYFNMKIDFVNVLELLTEAKNDE